MSERRIEWGRIYLATFIWVALVLNQGMLMVQIHELDAQVSKCPIDVVKRLERDEYELRSHLDEAIATGHKYSERLRALEENYGTCNAGK